MERESESLPQYKRLYELLRQNIENGLYKEGTLLPSENELCRLHNITRPTVRQALTALVNDGFILKQKGKGSIVASLPQNIGILSLQSTTTAIAGKMLNTKILDGPLVCAWPKPFSFELPQGYDGVGCYKLERLRLIDNKPVFYEITYLPNINLPRFGARSFENRSLFDVLRSNYQIEVKGGAQQISAVKASKLIASFLDIRPGNPVVYLARKIETNRLGFVFYSFIYGNTESYVLSGSF